MISIPLNLLLVFHSSYPSLIEPLFQGTLDSSLLSNPLSYHLPEDEDHSIQPAGRKCTDHSFDEIDMATLPHSFDFSFLPPSNTDSSYLIQPNSDGLCFRVFIIHSPFLTEELHAICETYSGS